METINSTVPANVQPFSPPAQKSSRIPLRQHIDPARLALVKADQNVLEVVGSYVSLRRTGKIYVGRCPWHESKSGKSFVVSPEFGTWRCWSCNIFGDVFGFFQRYFSLNFNEAVSLLARRAGIDLNQPLPAGLAERVQLRAEIAEVDRQIAESLRAFIREISEELDRARKLRRSAAKRLAALKNGAKARWMDEHDLCLDAMATAQDRIRKMDVAYCIASLAPREQRERFAAFPEQRNEMIEAALLDGFVANERGYRYQVPLQ